MKKNRVVQVEDIPKVQAILEKNIPVKKETIEPKTIEKKRTVKMFDGDKA